MYFGGGVPGWNSIESLSHRIVKEDVVRVGDC